MAARVRLTPMSSSRYGGIVAALLLLLSCCCYCCLPISAADPRCVHGILDGSADVCCAKSCGRCGGTSCQNFPGGRKSCCTSKVRNDGHSCTRADPPCVMPIAPPGPPPPPARAVNPKRGFVADGAASCDTPLLLNASGWYYDYNQKNPYRSGGLKGDCKRANATDKSRFVPM
jgi:hypothetical protein